jgi:hypothetical protein
MSERQKQMWMQIHATLSGRVEAGMNSKTRSTGTPVTNSVQELSDRRTKELLNQSSTQESDTPLFLMDTSDGKKG